VRRKKKRNVFNQGGKEAEKEKTSRGGRKRSKTSGLTCVERAGMEVKKKE